MGTIVEVIIETPKTEYWDVPGSTFPEIDLNNPDLGGYPGYYNGTNENSVADVVDGFVKSYKIIWSSRIILPRWPGYDAGTKAQKNEWDRFVKALKSHELKHHEIAVNGINRLAEELRKTDALTLEQLKQKNSETDQAIGAEQKEYDDRTNHGATEGAELDLGIGGGGGDTSPKPNPGSGGGGGCFEGSTIVLMADGSRKQIDQVKPGDMLWVCSLDGAHLFKAELQKMDVEPHRDFNTITFSDGSSMVVSRRQPILTVCGPVKSDLIIAGSQVFSLPNGEPSDQPEASKVAVVESVVTTFSTIDLYCPDFDGDYCLFAGGNTIALPGTNSPKLKN